MKAHFRNMRFLVTAAIISCSMPTVFSVFVKQARYVELQTTLGTVRGVEELDEKTGRRVVSFYGIPFAEPPVKELRFRPPVPKKAWTGVWDCTHEIFNQVCPQYKGNYGQEDCLYLNVYIPITDNDTSTPLNETLGAEKFSMFFWIYGGGFIFGDDYTFGYYDGKNLASGRTVVVVEPNYRIGAFGFLALEALAEEMETGTMGNMGIQDQQLALRFAFENANVFSGIERDITIAGESAGAMSVCWHIVSEVSTRYFRAAVMESGTCSSAIFFVKKDRALTFGKELLDKVNCSLSTSSLILECLRSRDIKDFYFETWDPIPIPGTNHSISPPLSAFMPYGPTIDGKKEGLVARPIELLGKMPWTKKPLIQGCNKNEGSIFMKSLSKQINVTIPLNKPDFEAAMLHFFNETTVTDINKYYKDAGKDYNEKAEIVLRDNMFLCSTQYAAEELSKADVPVWRYFFTAYLPLWLDYDFLGDYHTLEIDFVFNNPFPAILHPWGLAEEVLADNVGTYWSNLARFADVNGGPVHKTWPRFDIKTRQHMNLQVPLQVGEKLEYETCEFWRTRKMKFD
eukprot:m.114207 g.114207  ORF g.114207 m.114207 type:complete len:569 (+) comp14157_c0_seq1:121-1827(+)